MLVYQPMSSFKPRDRLSLPPRSGPLCIHSADSATATSAVPTVAAAKSSPGALLPLWRQLITVEFVALLGFFSIFYYYNSSFISARRSRCVRVLEDELAEPFLLVVNVVGSVAVVCHA
jgi:hypothetical protein